MNHTHLKTLITVLTKVNPNEFDISSEFNKKYDSEDEYHEPTKADFKKHVCGTTVCAAGFAALDPTCNALGLRATVDRKGLLTGFKYKGLTGYHAMAEFLDISNTYAEHLFAYWGDTTMLYGKISPRVTVYDVIYQLEFLRLTGELHFGYNATSKFTMADAMDEIDLLA